MARSLLVLVFAWALLAIAALPMTTQAAPLPQLNILPLLGLGLGGGNGKATKSATSTTRPATTTTTSKPTSTLKLATIAAAVTSPIATSTKAATTSTKTTTTSSATTTLFDPNAVPTRLAAATGKIRGVNLGGWFVLENFLSPSVFSAAQQAGGSGAPLPQDQWGIMTTINNNAKALQILQQHWSSFIVESDFAQIKSLGLNTVRIPVPHWAFTNSSSEPYISGAELPYIDQAVSLAAKYGLDVMLDMHTAPGSQNGFDNSGHIGAVGFGTSPDNANRLYDALTAMVTRYVNDGKYGGVVKYVEILNEPLCNVLGGEYVASVYKTAADRVNAAITSSSRPQIILHDCFAVPLTNLGPFVSGGGPLAGTSFMIDTHRYHVFAPRENLSFQQHVALIKQDGDDIASATGSLGRQIVTGEFSLAISCSDCPKGYSSTVTAADVAKLNRQFFETQTVAYDRGAGWIFFNWAAENNWPWSFKTSYDLNWIPKNILAQDEAL